MADWGAKVSQEGYNVNTVADYQLLFNSSWPLLKVEKQGSFTVSNGSVDTVIYTHNLGYYPAFAIFANDNTDTGVTSGSLFASNNISGGLVGCNTTELKWFGGFFSDGTNPRTFYYYIYRLDLESTFTAPTINTTAGTQAIVSNYGIKATIPGKSVTSTDLRDYSVHSGTLSPLVHMIKSGLPTFNAPSSYHLTATHNFGYQTIYLTYTRNTTVGVGQNYYIQLGGQHQSQPASFADDNSVYIDFFNGTDIYGSIIVFKDPFSLNQTTSTVTY